MNHDHPITISSISELHRALQLSAPKNPMITLIDNRDVKIDDSSVGQRYQFDFYKIAFKKTLKGKIGYGQGYYDFDEGGLLFTSPRQVISIVEEETKLEGLMLMFHPDFIHQYPLGKLIKSYGFFDYETAEALHLSESEKLVILDVFAKIEMELQNPIDDFSQDVMVSYLDLLLNYSNRFYKRQFTTRKIVNQGVVTRIEKMLDDYFEKDLSVENGLPTVEYLASQMHLSPRYLSDLLRNQTGSNTQQIIHLKLIDRAKFLLNSTELSVAEIAYQLGFERPQSFNRLFKSKVNQTPLNYRLESN